MVSKRSCCMLCLGRSGARDFAGTATLSSYLEIKCFHARALPSNSLASHSVARQTRRLHRPAQQPPSPTILCKGPNQSLQTLRLRIVRKCVVHRGFGPHKLRSRARVGNLITLER